MQPVAYEWALADAMTPQEVDEMRERILRKLKRLSKRTRREQLEEGWTLDEEQDCTIPPGWVRA